MSKYTGRVFEHVSEVLVSGRWWGSWLGHGQGNTEGGIGAEGAALEQLGRVLVMVRGFVPPGDQIGPLSNFKKICGRL